MTASAEMNGLDRRAAVRQLLQHRDAGATETGPGLVITGLGSATWDVAAAGDRDETFYLWGAMGGAVAMGLGLALARPEKAVAVITGDGEALMGMGALATAARHAPDNLTIAVLDNGLYGETGMQSSAASGTVDLVALAQSCGIVDACSLEDEAALESFSKRVFDGAGLKFARIAISEAMPERVLPMRDGVLLKARFRSALDL